MEWAQAVAIIASSSGGTLIITKLFEKLPSMLNGRANRERSDVERALKEKREQKRLAEQEAARRRRYQESLSLHRRKMYEAPCINPDDIPPWPESEIPQM